MPNARDVEKAKLFRNLVIVLVIVHLLLSPSCRYFETAILLDPSNTGRAENFDCVRCFVTHLPSGGFLFTEPSAHLGTIIKNEKMSKNSTINSSSITSISNILFLHGGTDDLTGWKTLLNEFRSKKITVHMLEYAGFGGSGKVERKRISPTLVTILQDLREAWQVLRQMHPLDGGLVYSAGTVGQTTSRNLDVYSEIVVIGYALGGIVVSQWLTEVPTTEFPKGIILLNTPSIRTVVGKVTGFSPLVHLFENNWTAEKGLRRYTGSDSKLLAPLIVENANNLYVSQVGIPINSTSDSSERIKFGYVCIVNTQDDSHIIPNPEAAKLLRWSGKRARAPMETIWNDHFTSGDHIWFWAWYCLQ